MSEEMNMTTGVTDEWYLANELAHLIGEKVNYTVIPRRKSSNLYEVKVINVPKTKECLAEVSKAYKEAKEELGKPLRR